MNNRTARRGGERNRPFAGQIKKENGIEVARVSFKRAKSLECENINSWPVKNTVCDKLPPLRINANDIAHFAAQREIIRWSPSPYNTIVLRDRINFLESSCQISIPFSKLQRD